jgi:ParB family chromosome partitioning protein
MWKLNLLEKGKKGKIILDFASEEDLERILKLIGE